MKELGQKTQASVEEEEQLWVTEALSSSTPEGLLNAVFFYNAINFCLHSGEEHRGLRETQLYFSSESK